MMLAWPDANLRIHSDEDDAEKDTQLLCDWCEGQILFGEESEISLSSIVELMKENNVSDDDDERWFFAENAFLRLKKRHEALADVSPVEFSRSHAKLMPKISHTALKFCCMLALGDIFKNLRNSVFQPHPLKGFLFELLASEALVHLFPKWKTSRTGWSPDKSVRIDDLVKQLSGELNEREGDYGHWSGNQAKDEGLDLFCYFPFNDIHSGYPAFLFQCATGANWRSKTSTPDIEQWSKFVDFIFSPKRAFIIPFSLTEKDYRINCLKIKGPLLDRYRLLSFRKNEDEWLSGDLKLKLDEWLADRVKCIPVAE